MAEVEKKFAYFQPTVPTQPDHHYFDEDDDGGLWDQFKWKMKNSPFFPFVAIGVLGVVGSFGYGMMYGLAKGTTKGNIRGMTGRVSFQALAIAAIMGDIWWDTKNRKKMMAAAAAAKKT